MSETAALTTGDAVLLAHALVSRLASLEGARVLFIKGPTAVALGVRPPRPSSDVDALVDPVSFEAICAALERCGWSLRVPIGVLRHAADLSFEHSAHFVHPEWPCDLDVHYLFPGFLTAPEHVFDALWERRTTVPIAGIEVATPDLLGQGLVVGLHALRDPDRAASQEDLDHVVRALREHARSHPDSLAALSALAAATGSAGSAAALLERVGAPVPELSTQDRERLVNWEFRQHGLGSSTAWLAELQRAPWRRKPAVLRQALVPSTELLVGAPLAAQLDRGDVALLHLRRWWRGVRSLPHAIGVLARRHRAIGRTGASGPP